MSKFYFTLNDGHKDLMDCWIAASAIKINAIFLTKDKELKTLLNKYPEFKLNKILDWKKFRREL